MKTLLTVALLLLASVCYAGQKYNPYTHVWETTSEDSNLKYNPYERDWSYQKPDSQVEYNPYEKKWEWNQGLNPSPKIQ